MTLYFSNPGLNPDYQRARQVCYTLDHRGRYQTREIWVPGSKVYDYTIVQFSLNWTFTLRLDLVP